MQKGVSPSVAFVMLIVVILSTSTALYYWITAVRTPIPRDEYIQIEAYAINSSALRIINADTENSSSLNYLSTSIGTCNFSSPTVLQPGIAEVCVFSSPVANGTRIAVYAEDIKKVSVVF